MFNLRIAMLAVALLISATACTTTGTSGSSSSARSEPQVGDMVPFGQFGDPSDYPYMVVAYDKSLGTDHVIQNLRSQAYGEALNKANDNRNSGVNHYSGPPLKFRLVEVSGVAPGTMVKLLKGGRYVGTVPLAAGTVFEIGGDHYASAVFMAKRNAWTKDAVVCYEMLPGQGYHLADLPYKTVGKYKGRENLDCLLPGELSAGLNDPRSNRMRMSAIIAKNANQKRL